MKIGKVDIELYKKPGYNNPDKNERAVELALAFYFCKKTPEIVELGAVLPYYINATHSVYDLHDPYKNCIRINLENLNKYSLVDKNVVSISTLEHVGFDNYANQAIRQPTANWANGIKIFEKIQQEAKSYLITLPIGYNSGLDEECKKLPNAILLKRINEDNDWERTDSWSHKYNNPFFAANGLCILTNLEDLLE